jgi:hypothetical protein
LVTTATILIRAADGVIMQGATTDAKYAIALQASHLSTAGDAVLIGLLGCGPTALEDNDRCPLPAIHRMGEWMGRVTRDTQTGRYIRRNENQQV